MKKRREDPRGLISGPRPLVVTMDREATVRQREVVRGPATTIALQIGPRIRDLLRTHLTPHQPPESFRRGKRELLERLDREIHGKESGS